VRGPRGPRFGWAGPLLVGGLVAGLAALAGCGGDKQSPGALPSETGTAPATSNPATTTQATTPPSTGPGGVPIPKPGPRAGEQSDTGAKAFGVYFVKIMDYTYATRDVAPLRRASITSCALCAQVAKSVSKYRQPGYKFEGGRITLRNLTVSQPSVMQPVIVANISITALNVTAPDGRRDPYSGPAHPRAQLVITERWTGSSWTVSDLLIGA
jgi:hypothetical protein